MTHRGSLQHTPTSLASMPEPAASNTTSLPSAGHHLRLTTGPLFCPPTTVQPSSVRAHALGPLNRSFVSNAMRLILRVEQVFVRRRTKAQMCAALPLQLALLYVALEPLRLRACVFCIVDRTRTLCLSRACCLLQTALGIMSAFAVGTTSAIDDTTNTCVKI